MSNLNLKTSNAVAYTNNNTIIKMNSQEIADLVQARHDNVKRTIETLVSSGVIASPQTEDVVTTSNNRQYTSQNYVFEGEQGKRDTTIIVAQLSPQFLGTVVDRWMYLEKQLLEMVKPSYMIEDPIERAKKWIEEASAKQEVESKLIEATQVIEIQAPKAEVFDAVLDKSRTYSIREFAQRTGVQEMKVKKCLKENSWMNGSSSTTYRPLSEANKNNYMRMVRSGKPFTTQYGTTRYNESIVFTQEGFNEAVRKMVKSGMMKPLAADQA